MSRKLATVRTIAELKPIEGADLIELAIVDGWQCVVKKGEHKLGDKVVYFEVDSFIPATLPFMESFKERLSVFNDVEGLRVRSIKLRGQISQGVIVSIPTLPFEAYRTFVDEDTSPDGSAVVGVCSRNVNLKEEAGGVFWSAAKDLGIIDAIKGCGRDLAIQGELIAPSIQGNFEGVTQPEIHIYDVYDIEEQKYLTPLQRLQVLSSLGLDHLAIKQVGIGSPAAMFGGDLAKALDYAEGDGLYSGYREGVVFKSFVSDKSFKIISNQYLLKEK